MEMYISEKVILDSATQRTFTDEGYLKTKAFIARTGVQDYLAMEFGKEGVPASFAKDPMRVIKVFRSQDEVFSDDTLDSFANKPITDDHPPEFVTADNWSKYSKGHIDGRPWREGDRIAANLVVMDKKLIEKIQSGKAEISMGYSAAYEFKQGRNGDIVFDAAQRNIRGNHAAVVDAGRAGKTVRIFDSQPKGKKMPEVILNKATVQVTDSETADIIQGEFKAVNDALSIEKDRADKATASNINLQQQFDDSQTEVVKLRRDLKEATNDAVVDERIKLIADADMLKPGINCRGKSATEIRQEAMSHHTSKSFSDHSSDVVKYAFDEAVMNKKENEEDEDDVKKNAADSLANLQKGLTNGVKIENSNQSQAVCDAAYADYLKTFNTGDK
ncbi:head maturation protease [Vibrio phage D81]